MPKAADLRSLKAEARAATERQAPSLNQARRALDLMPATSPRQLRDRAVFALLCLTGIRVAALISLRIKHIDLAEKSVTQNPREVATKFGQRIDTFFEQGFPEAEEALAQWVAHLDETELYGPDDPAFPATAVRATAADGFKAQGFKLAAWTTTEPVRKIVNEAFASANLPAFGPHAFRHMLARHKAKSCKSVTELVATSQNLVHTDVLITLRSYGQISRERQRALITGASLDGHLLDD